MKKTDIVITVCLDKNRVPEKMSWSAKDGGVSNQETKAFLFSSWDDVNQETMKIDLWTKDMPLDEMKIFFHQILSSMATTFNRATQDDKMYKTMLDFCDYFAEKLELKK